eukprot:4828535-Pleurochrysis_carterae.AAC.1
MLDEPIQPACAGLRRGTVVNTDNRARMTAVPAAETGHHRSGFLKAERNRASDNHAWISDLNYARRSYIQTVHKLLSLQATSRRVEERPRENVQFGLRLIQHRFQSWTTRANGAVWSMQRELPEICAAQ